MTEASPKSNSLAINDLFWTLQGEGRWAGYRALFIRLPFCNYDCPWCDTEFQTFKKWSLEDFKAFCLKEPSRFAVVTGGEPLLHKDLNPILKILKSLNFRIACETNGSAVVPDLIDFVTVSPKPYTKGKLPAYYVDPQAMKKADEFKYVVDSEFDYDILERHSPPDPSKAYSLSPEFSQMTTLVAQVMDFIKKNPQWRLNLQTHKWIDIP